LSFNFSKMTSSRPSRPIVVAEVGTAHGGDLKRGLELIDAAADAGADIAKVQVVFAEEILPPEAGLVPLPGGNTPLYEVFRSLERPVDFYAALAERAAARGIGFLASPFGERSVRLLEEIGVKAWKVASPELNHEPLLERLARTGLPLILSTGVSEAQDIERALEVVRGAYLSRGSHPGTGRSPGGLTLPIILLHCLTNYPAPEEEANLLVIPTLAAMFGLPAGLSDHSMDPVLIPSLAAALGAVMIEKHITLDRSAGGLDDPVALTPEAFARMTAAVKRYALPVAGGRPYTHRSALEPAVERPLGASAPPDPDHQKAVIKELAAEYGRKRVEACLGDGQKRLAGSEAGHYGRTNRSIHAVGALKSGSEVSRDNTALLRTEKVLRPGIEPRFRGQVYGRRLIRDVASGDGITWDDLD
jgi:N-acetylneuraminate synthase